ncbi:MAG: flavodoxin family protein [Elusimicrobia bacterium]|nr:flavodoxin family protein [Elusimicrobiota bacterium]
MKIVVLIGSRNEIGQTASLVNAFLEGAGKNNAVCEKIFLTKKKIEHCRQCEDTGWGICKTEGKCIIDDDFKAIVDSLKNADKVVIATPVYFSDLSESLKTFLDRFRRTCRHDFGKKGISGKQVLGICVAGGGGGGAPLCVFLMERILNTCCLDIVDMIPARRQNLGMKLSVAKTTGEWFSKP